ncbi:hypothetical protein AABB24_039921 [Solanum stoloniferum]|uniref:Uncharacterized protein n=1 Tax=Solanum stoloniferum TaxID=62892 RepID=A0ABD2QSP7_9SOLN
MLFFLANCSRDLSLVSFIVFPPSPVAVFLYGFLLEKKVQLQEKLNCWPWTSSNPLTSNLTPLLWCLRTFMKAIKQLDCQIPVINEFRPAKIDTALNYFNEPSSIAPTDLHLGVTSTWSFKSKQGSRLRK